MKIHIRCLSLLILIASIISLATGCDQVNKEFDYVEDDGKITITGYLGDEKDLTIPSEIHGRKVTAIGESAFRGCSFLETVTLPEGLTSIGNNAFLQCSSLGTVTLPDSLTSIGDVAFMACKALTVITIPQNVASIASTSFYGCDSLTDINVVPENPNFSSEDGILYTGDMTVLIACPSGRRGMVNISEKAISMEYGAFQTCKYVTGITLPASLTAVSDYAFSECESLERITIPAAVSTIGSDAFLWCNAMTDIDVSANNPYFSDEDGILYNKDKTCLIRCPGGKSDLITIPDTVTKIDAYSFYTCGNVKSIILPEGVTSIGDCAFPDNDDLVIYCKEGSAAHLFAKENEIAYELM